MTIAQINPVVGDLSGNAARITQIINNHAETDIILFPELVTCGYPPEDLVLRPSFVTNITYHIKDICKNTSSFSGLALVSSPWQLEDGRLVNAVLVLSSGDIKAVIPKVHLPNYDVFDEARIFKSGAMPEPYEYKGIKLGICTCEDLWYDDVAAHLKTEGAEIFLIPNGSPYDTEKLTKRHELIAKHCTAHNIPAIYVNQIGGQDELVFDGRSFVMNAKGQICHSSPAFQENITTLKLSTLAPAPCDVYTPDKYEDIYEALCLGLHDYVRKNGFKGVLIGLSGGIDSALSSVIACDALGADNVHCVMMPSPYTAKISLDDAATLAKNLGCAYDITPIKDAVSSLEHTIGKEAREGLAAENLQSRLRGLILMTLSNAQGHMVLSTGNKSEMAVGYATLYGDMCGGFNALKDVYKTDVFALSRFVNERAGTQRIPERIITRPPSAELRPDQKDEDSLPPYEELDAILHAIIEQRQGLKEMIAAGHDKATIKKIWHLLNRAEYKRRQAPPGTKISAKAFGRDRRYPITNRYREE